MIADIGQKKFDDAMKHRGQFFCYNKMIIDAKRAFKKLNDKDSNNRTNS